MLLIWFLILAHVALTFIFTGVVVGGLFQRREHDISAHTIEAAAVLGIISWATAFVLWRLK